MSDRGKLGNFLKEVINWDWAEFIKAEKEPQYTGYQASVFSLVRTASGGRLGAIKLAIDRVDGKIETPVRIEYPKIYFTFPEATGIALAPPGEAAARLPALNPLPDVVAPEVPEEDHEPKTAAVLSLRETLNKLADSPRQVTQMILVRKLQVETEKSEVKDGEDVAVKVPLVKSVIAANLLALAERNNFEAITEVFDQIDGKLVETIRILGDDLFLSQYALEAPFGSVKNKEGIYMLEMKAMTDQWKQKLKKD